MWKTSTIRGGGYARWLPLAKRLAAGLVVCIYLTYGLDRSLWLDEANTVLIADGSPKQIIDSLSRDISPPLYYFLLSGWMRFFGDSEIAVRLPSILSYLAGICVMWFLGRMLLGVEGAELASFLYAINPIVGRQAQNARMYTMLALMVALSMIVFGMLVRDAEHRSTRRFALFGLIAFLGLNTHYWFAFVLIAYGCWVILTWRSWSMKELALLVVVTVGPFLVFDLSMFLRQFQLPAGLWTPRPRFATLVKAIVGNFGLVPPHFVLAVVSAIALSAPILWSVRARRCTFHAAVLRIAFFAVFLYAIALTVPFLMSLRKPSFWPGRYDIIVVPFFAIGAASLLLCLPVRARAVFQLLLAGSCAFYFVQSVRDSQVTGHLGTLDPVPLGDRAAATAICAQSAPGDFVVYTGLSRAAVSYYLQRFKCNGKLRQVSYPAEFEQHLGWQDPRRNYSQEPEIVREGQSVVAAAHASTARIFLLLEPDRRLSAGMVAPIEHSYRFASSQRFEASYFNEVRVYVPNSERK